MYPLGFGFFDSTMIILIPTIILTLYAQSKVNSNFKKYLKVPTKKDILGYR